MISSDVIVSINRNVWDLTRLITCVYGSYFSAVQTPTYKVRSTQFVVRMRLQVTSSSHLLTPSQSL